jgi:aminopeptidase-like protein
MKNCFEYSGFDFKSLYQELWPITRSITGKGVRDSLDIISKTAPFDKLEFPSGLQCFDWEVPPEWNIEDAFVEDNSGNRLIDMNENNLHLMGYSIPLDKKVSREELLEHLHTLPEMPDAIPYRTSYYKENWGFCLQHNKLDQFTDKEYRVRIDSSLKNGFLTIGHAYLPGETDKEVLLSSYLCHPSLANNELSGPIAIAAIYQAVLNAPQRRYSYRFLLGPETIGPIVYLSQNLEELKNKVLAGYCLSMVGNDAPLLYKRSRHQNSIADRAAANILSFDQRDSEIYDWSPMGGTDQRQYCSIGVNLPIGYFGRALARRSYPEYHTSKDTLAIISMERMDEVVEAVLKCLNTIERNAPYLNTNPCCEPQLGKRGLYPTIGGKRASDSLLRIKYLLSLSDGKHDLIDIADSLRIQTPELFPETAKLIEAGLLRAADR